MKKILTLLLAMVLCAGLAVPASAASVAALEPDAADAVESPRYAALPVGCRLYIGSLTYADLVFSVSDRGGNDCFESLDSISFSTANSSGIHWQVTDYSCRLSDTVCELTVSRMELHGDTPTGYSDTATFSLPIETVVRGAGEGGAVIASSVNCVVVETYAVRMSWEELLRQVAASGIESVTRVPVRCAD